VSHAERSGERLSLDLSGVRLRLEGLSQRLATRLREEWSPFLAPAHQDPYLRMAVTYERGTLPLQDFAPKQMAARLGAREARFSMPEGSATVRESGEADLLLLEGLDRREFFTLVNLLRACLAWSMPGRGGMLLHAAGLVVEGRAFLLVGGEGSGKSTWARLGESRGARVLSDDLVLVDGSGSELEALGAPFRSTHVADYRPGRWPLAALLFPRHGTPPALNPVDKLSARARIVANLPFVAEAIADDDRLPTVLSRVVRSVACSELRFALEPSFVELLSA
jgi:hypothetical protein